MRTAEMKKNYALICGVKTSDGIALDHEKKKMYDCSKTSNQNGHKH